MTAPEIGMRLFKSNQGEAQPEPEYIRVGQNLKSPNNQMNKTGGLVLSKRNYLSHNFNTFVQIDELLKTIH